MAAGARQVFVVGGTLRAEANIEVRPGVPQLPLKDASVDLVACIEPYAALDGAVRRELLREAERVLRSDGVLAAWIEHPDGEVFGGTLEGPRHLDFWTLEDELAGVFDRVHMLAQMPWQGFSFAPIVDGDGAPAPKIDEGLLSTAPVTSHYLAIACKGASPPGLISSCLLVPLPSEAIDDRSGATDAELDELRAGLERMEAETETAQTQLAEARTQAQQLRYELEGRSAQAAAAQGHVRELELELETRGEAEERVRGELEDARRRLEQAEHAHDELVQAQQQAEAVETDLTVLGKTVKDQERALARAHERLDEQRREAESLARANQEIEQSHRELSAEREELARQIEVALAEREGARQLANRVEAELEQVQRRLAEQEQQLSDKREEASRLAGEAEAMRERLRHQEDTLQRTRSRAEELSASAAQSAEQGRMLADVALDRDRLREELARRASQIETLEQRLWEVREAAQKESLEHVRLAAEIERYREQADRSHRNEQGLEREVESLSADLRSAELERTELRAVLRSREEQIERMTADVAVAAGQAQDVSELQEQLRERGAGLADLRVELEQSRVRERDARELAAQREKELAEAHGDVQRLRAEAGELTEQVAHLRDDLEVERLKSKQLESSIAKLREHVDEQRDAIRSHEDGKMGLQRELEEAAAEQQVLRARLRERDQQLDDTAANHESTREELAKLREEVRAAAVAQEQLERVLEQALVEPDEETVARRAPSDGNGAAQAHEELRRLRTQLEEQAQHHDERVRAAEAQQDAARVRGRKYQREADIRAEEQEYMLGRLDEAEQKIWMMSDAADRNAARLAAGLAQLDQNKTKLAETRDELEVTRKLLQKAQARALAQERLLAIERAKLARAGIEASTAPESQDALAHLTRRGSEMVSLDDEPPTDGSATGDPSEGNEA